MLDAKRRDFLEFLVWHHRTRRVGREIKHQYTSFGRYSGF